MALNLDSAFFASRAAIPYLKKAMGASIVNYTSNAGWNAHGPDVGIYGVPVTKSQPIFVLQTQQCKKLYIVCFPHRHGHRFKLRLRFYRLHLQ